jgi:hypothetical protein
VVARSSRGEWPNSFFAARDTKGKEGKESKKDSLILHCGDLVNAEIPD